MIVPTVRGMNRR